MSFESIKAGDKIVVRSQSVYGIDFHDYPVIKVAKGQIHSFSLSFDAKTGKAKGRHKIYDHPIEYRIVPNDDKEAVAYFERIKRNDRIEKAKMALFNSKPEIQDAIMALLGV